MAIYKIFSEKDTFISSKRSNQNFGRDEILEISNETELVSLFPDVTRALIQFPNNQIVEVIDNLIQENEFKANLKLFLAEATIPSEYNIYVYPLSSSWINGLGKSGDKPINNIGNTWDSWNTPGGDFLNLPFSQSFNHISNKDINLEITPLINEWYSSSLNNYGVILKHDNLIENSNIPISLKFFSMDTHTIYPPQLEFKWDDSIYNTTLTQVLNSNFSSTISNLKTEFEENTIYKFRIKVRDKYPTRQFSTSSVYLNTKALPSSSYWALKDVKTEEMVIDFDTNYTKISCDNTSNYFKLYMNGLEPERYYQILYKIILNNSEIIIIDDNTNYFKIVR
jgi:hypothetical protein